MQVHGQMRDRGWIPEIPLMDHQVVHKPSDPVWAPLDGVAMQPLRGIKTEVDVAWTTSVMRGHNRPVVTGYNSFTLSIKARIAAGMWRRLG